ncbi:MAG: hypothetical protein AB7S44_00840 [Spirochaetales bacterium]
MNKIVEFIRKKYEDNHKKEKDYVYDRMGILAFFILAIVLLITAFYVLLYQNDTETFNIIILFASIFVVGIILNRFIILLICGKIKYEYSINDIIGIIVVALGFIFLNWLFSFTNLIWLFVLKLALIIFWISNLLYLLYVFFDLLIPAGDRKFYKNFFLVLLNIITLVAAIMAILGYQLPIE